MILLETVEEIHAALIKEHGGSYGIRDENALNSALIRPFQKFENKSLYPNTVDKAAALIESIIKNHPFIDGNKRTGYVLMRLLPINNKVDILASENEKFDFVTAIADGSSNYNDILHWLTNHLIHLA